MGRWRWRWCQSKLTRCSNHSICLTCACAYVEHSLFAFVVIWFRSVCCVCVQSSVVIQMRILGYVNTLIQCKFMEVLTFRNSYFGSVKMQMKWNSWSFCLRFHFFGFSKLNRFFLFFPNDEHRIVGRTKMKREKRTKKSPRKRHKWWKNPKKI